MLVDLNGNWQFQQAGGNEWLPATVPGNNYSDLFALKRIPDPFFGENEWKVLWVGDADWDYRRTFDVDAALLNSDRVFLECDGLDTLATVFVNGQHAGASDNMFRPCRFDVKRLLKAGANDLRIRFDSPTQYALKKSKHKGEIGVNDALPGVRFLRKAQCHFGWDWGIKLPVSGIWRGIRIAGRNAARFEDVHVRQQHRRGAVTVSVKTALECYRKTPLTLRVTLRGSGGSEQRAEVAIKPGASEATVALNVANPQLWWPNGYGAQPLYELTTELLCDGQVIDSDRKRLGLRTIELLRKKDKWGESFTFVANGVKIFAKGSNWIPADAMPNRVTPQLYRHLLTSAAQTNQNMIRVWGGGYYEEETFYDLCDELGLLVWQDFMFACAVYPIDAAFFENVRTEVIANVRRLRHRACVALWCGNNEMEQGWVDWGWSKRFSAAEKAGYDRMFHKLFPKWIPALDPDRAYWPSSASSGTPFVKPNGEERGDGHYWSVWHGGARFPEYRKHYYRFQSEFGFQSLPPFETVKTYAEPRDMNMTSRVMEHHQRSRDGNGKIVSHLTAVFRMPKDFESLCYVSQVLQAESIRYGVEHWRRHSYRCSGTLYWQLNDCWPVCSWSSVDYFGRWKALHYLARRFYAPVLLSAEEEGPRVPLYVTNDQRQPFGGKVEWRVETLAGEVIQKGSVNVKVAAGGSKLVKDLDFSKLLNRDNRSNLICVYELHGAAGLLSRALCTFVPAKHLELADPQLAAEVTEAGDKWQVRVRAKTLARFVEIDREGSPPECIWSDNYFDLPAESECVVSCSKRPGETLEAVRQSLRVRSLWNS